MSDNLAHHAKLYAEKGFRVILLHGVYRPDPTNPICTCYKGIACKATGKHPRLNNWVELASNDPNVVREWWRIKPNSNIGLAMGFNSIVALDIDGDEGHKNLKQLEAQYGELPATLTQQTGRGGVSEHRLFYTKLAGVIRNTTSKLGKGLDVRASGSLIVAAPSMHKYGGRYKWRNDLPIANMPTWLEALLATPQMESSAYELPDDSTLPSVLRRATRARRYIYFAPSAVEGQNGSLTTFKVALAVVRGFCVPAEEALKILKEEYNPRCEPPWTDQELQHKIESAANDATVPWGYLLDE